MSREAMKMALEALEDIGDEWGFTSQRTVPKRKEALTAIKEALAQPEVFSKQNYLNSYCAGRSDLLAEQAKQEPAAWMVYTQDGQSVYVTDNPTEIQENQRALPMYTTPPQRKPLTDEEIRDALEAEFLHSDGKRNWQDDLRVARAIEAAHGIKGEA